MPTNEEIIPSFPEPEEPANLVENYLKYRQTANDPEAMQVQADKDSFQDSINTIGDKTRAIQTLSDTQESSLDPELDVKLKKLPYWVQAGDDVVTQTAGGTLDYINEVYQFASGDDPNRIPKGTDKADWVDVKSRLRYPEPTIVPTLDKPRTMVGEFVRPTAQFFSGFLPGLSLITKATPGNVLKSWPKVKALFQAEVAGGVTDFTGFDPNDPNIGNLYVQLLGEDGFGSAVMEEWLATDVENSELDNRLKNAIAGSLIGMGFQGTVKGTVGLSKFIKDATVELFNGLKNYRASLPAFKVTGKRITAKIPDDIEIVEDAVTRSAPDTARGAEGTVDDLIANANKEQRFDSDGQPLSNVDEAGNPIVKPDTTEVPDTASTAKPTEAAEEVTPEAKAAKAEEEAREAERLETIKHAMAVDELKLKQADASNFKIVNGRRVPKDPEDYHDPAIPKGGPKKPKRPGRRLKTPAEQREITARLAERIKNKDLEGASDLLRDRKDINLGKTNTDQEMKELINTTTKELGPAARTYKVTNADTQELADYIGSSVKAVRKLYKDVVEGDLAASFLAARHLLIESTDMVRNLAAKAVTGNREAQVEFQKHLYRHQALQHQISGIKTEVARTLQAMGIKADNELVKFNNLEEIINNHGGEDQLKKVAQRILDIADDPEGRKLLGRVMRKTKWHKAKSVLHEMVITGWLSGVSTHVANAFGNAYALSTAIIERGVAGTRLAGRNHSAIETREALDMVHGVTEAFWDSLKVAARTWRTGKAKDLRTKLEIAPGAEAAPSVRTPAGAISAEGLELKGPLGAAADFFGGTLRKFSTDALLAGDDFFKGLNYKAELHALARRKARKLAGGDAQEASRLYSEYLTDPPADVHASALEFARVNTFTNQAAFNSAPDMVKNLVRSDPTGLLKLYFPFIQTPLNITGSALHRMPLVNKAFPNYRAQLNSKDPAVRQLARAKSRVGGLAMTSFMGLAANGYLTGARPKDLDEQKRFEDAGGQYNSIYIKGLGWLNYERLGPIAVTLGTAADLVTAVQGSFKIYHEDLSEEERAQYDKTYGDIAQQLAVAMGHNLFDTNFMGEIPDFIDLVEGKISPAAALSKKLGSSVVPLNSMHRDLTNFVDPNVVDVRRDDFYEELKATIKRDLRLWRHDDNEFKYDLMGNVEKMGLPDASLIGRAFDEFGNPAKRATPSKGWLFNEMYLYGARASRIKKDESISISEITGATPEGVPVPGVILEPKERTFLAKEWGRLNTKSVAKLRSSTEYASASPGEKKVLLENHLNRNKQNAQLATVSKFPRIANQQNQQRLNEMRFNEDRTAEPLDQTTQPLIPN